MAILTFWLDDFYELPLTTQEDFINNNTIVFRNDLVFVFLDDKEQEEVDLDSLF